LEAHTKSRIYQTHSQQIKESIEKAKKEHQKLLKKEKIKTIKKLDQGLLYLVDERKTIASFKLFETNVKLYERGLVFSRTNPKLLKFKNTEVLWLTTAEVKENTYSPTSLSRIYSKVKDFSENEGIVLLDGLMLIMNYAGYNQAYNLLARLKEVAAQKNLLIIVPLNTEAIPNKEKERFLNEFNNL